MKLVRTIEDLVAVDLLEVFLLQCPKTNIVYTMQRKFIQDQLSERVYYYATQDAGDTFLVDTDIPHNCRERYYFNPDRLRELLENKLFAMER